MKKLIILGAGGHGKVAADCARAMQQFDSISFIDATYPERKQHLDWPIVNTVENWGNYISDSLFFVAIGDNSTRMKWISKLTAGKAKLANLIHPSATCSESISMGSGNCVFANAVLNPAVKIGDGCIINTGATVDHDCQLSNGVHISPGANLAGQVSIGATTWIGVGASIIQCVTIAEQVMIGAGAAVINNIEKPGTYVGVPAIKIK